MSEFAIPEKCDGCTVQCELALGILAAEFILEKLTEGAVGLMGEEGQQFEDGLLSVVGDPESAHAFATLIRKDTGRTLEELDQDIQDAKEESASNALSCDGVLKMRAKKAGKTYTVAVCTSAKQNMLNQEAPQHATTHIWVRTQN